MTSMLPWRSKMVAKYGRVDSPKAAGGGIEASAGMRSEGGGAGWLTLHLMC